MFMWKKPIDTYFLVCRSDDKTGDAREQPKSSDPQQGTVQPSDTSEKSQVLVFVAKLKNPTHVFEYTKDELDDFFEANKAKEILLMKTPANLTDVQSGQSNIECSVDEAINSTILPTLTMSTELGDEQVVDPIELQRSEERIQRLEKELQERNKQYLQLHEMYMVVQSKLSSVLAELQKQRYFWLNTKYCYKVFWVTFCKKFKIEQHFNRSM